jgi:alpha-glucosidase (family GH31 glycosyl hydrolase)
MKPTVKILCAVFLSLPILCAADTGSVVSWSSNSLNELTFTCQTAVVKLELVDANVARVRMEPSGFVFNTNASFTVVKQWARPPISVVDGDPLTVTTSGLRVEVNKNPFRLTFRKPDGTVWLSSDTSDGFSSFEDDALTNRGATFQMASGEQFYGLGLVLGQPLSYRGQIRSLYNDRAHFQYGAMTDMAVPLVLSSKGYGLFLDNTFSQLWDFICSDNTHWRATVTGGELDYYFIGADGLADALDRYTQITGRSPLPPRWALGYMQSRYGYRNWSEMYAARDTFRTNDMPCDAMILDLYWWGRRNQMGALRWDPTNFPDASTHLAELSASGIKVISIHEEYLNQDNPPAKTNFDQAAALHYLVSTNEEMTAPSILENKGFYDEAGYFDFLNPDARRWWFTKIKPLVDDGLGGFWTDLGEPEADHRTDFLYDGHRESEIHNVYNLLWHQALADGFATYYPNRRLYILSRSGFAGDQRFGVGHWTNDTRSNWQTLAAHLNALCNYGFSGMSYFGSDIGGFTGIPSEELYTRWFQFGAFCPVFRAHGRDPKPVAPYQFGPQVLERCRTVMKLRYQLLPYIYTAARETFDTGMPMCRALPLAFPHDTNVVLNGTQFMFGSNIMVAPVTTEGMTSRSVYLPAGSWIDLWSGQSVAGPVTTNWPAPMTQIPAFYRDNSITPLGPDVQSTQFDDGTQRGLRIYCSTRAKGTVYDDDGASNGYRSHEFATTSVSAENTHNMITIGITGAVGSYTGEPAQRQWQVELYCTNPFHRVTADGIPLRKVNGADALASARSGCYFDAAQHLLHIRLPSAPISKPHHITISYHK